MDLPILQVTLVHGTWGRGFFPNRFHLRSPRVRWFEADSQFVLQLTEKLAHLGVAPRIRAFPWSGANSIAARDTASRDLAALIENDSVGQDHLIIGHSHGGNVVVRGISRCREESSRRMMIVTLATPFLDVSPRATRDLEEYFILLTCFAIPLLIAVFVAGSLMWLFIGYLGLDDFRYWNEWWNTKLLGARPHMILTIFSAMTAGFVAFEHLADPFNSKVIGLPDRNFEASSRIADQVAALILRSVDDEPNIAFAIAALGNRIVAIALHVTVLSVVFTPTAVIAYLIAGLFANAIFNVNPNEFYTAIPYMLGFAFLAGPISSVGLVLLSGVMRSVCGRELLLGAFRQDVAFNSTPDHVGKITIKTLVSAGGLRHSIYHHPDCVSTIAIWAAGNKSSNPVSP